MIRYFYFEYDDHVGCSARTFVDASAAIKEWMHRVFGNEDHIEDWVRMLEHQGFVEHTYEDNGIVAVTRTEVF